MSILKKLETLLDQDTYSSVVEQVGNTFEGAGEYIPKSRLDSVIAQRNKLSDKVIELEETISNTPDPSTEPEDFEEKLTTARTEAYNQAKLEMAIKSQLGVEKAHDVDMAYSLLDLETITLGEDGKLEGFSEQIAPLKDSKKFMFEAEVAPPSGTGKGSKPKENVEKNAVDKGLSDMFSRYGVGIEG